MTIREKFYIIVFGADTKAGRQFDIALLWLILFSVLCVILESIPVLGNNFKSTFLTIELAFTLIFSIEYFLKIRISPKPFNYLSGKFISSFVMIIGYAIIAVPTGIFTAEMMKSTLNKKKCAECSQENEISANYCSNCGHSFTL